MTAERAEEGQTVDAVPAAQVPARRWRLFLDMGAVTTDDLADKLNDIATDIIRGETPRKSVFGSVSCGGYVEITELPDA